MNSKIKTLISRLNFHGPSDLIQSVKVWQKVIWTIALSCAFIAVGFGIYGNVRDFRNGFILTSFALKPNSVDFPEIYICPANVLSSRAPDYERIKGKEFLNSAEDGTILGKITKVWDKTNKLSGGDGGFARPADLPKLVNDYGFQVDEFLTQCSFKRKPLKCNDITKRLFDKDYGLCFLIQLTERQTVAGAGLRLVVDMHSDDRFFDPFLNGVAVRILHKHDPTRVGYDVFVNGGGVTKISLEATHLTLINYKSRTVDQKCFDKAKWDPIFFKVMDNLTYTQSACRMDCVQVVVNRECKCNLPMDKQFLKSGFTEHCSANKIKSCFLKDVMENVTLEQETSECTKKCLEPCETWKYSYSMTSNDFADLTDDDSGESMSSGSSRHNHGSVTNENQNLPETGNEGPLESGNEGPSENGNEGPLESENEGPPESENEGSTETEIEGPPESENEGPPESENEGLPESENEGPPESKNEGPLESGNEGPPESEIEVPTENGNEGPLESGNKGTLESRNEGPLQSGNEGSLESGNEGQLESGNEDPLESSNEVLHTTGNQESPKSETTVLPEVGIERLLTNSYENNRSSSYQTEVKSSSSSSSVTTSSTVIVGQIADSTTQPVQMTNSTDMTDKLAEYFKNFQFEEPTGEKSRLSLVSSVRNRKKRQSVEPVDPANQEYDEERIKSDYIILDIAFGEVEYREIKQKPAMTVETFMSNIGGQLGFWLGASILSLVQIIGLSIFCCFGVFNRKAKQTKVRASIAETSEDNSSKRNSMTNIRFDEKVDEGKAKKPPPIRTSIAETSEENSSKRSSLTNVRFDEKVDEEKPKKPPPRPATGFYPPKGNISNLKSLAASKRIEKIYQS